MTSAQAAQLFLNLLCFEQCCGLSITTGIAVGVFLILESPILPKHFFHKNFKYLIITIYRLRVRRKRKSLLLLLYLLQR